VKVDSLQNLQTPLSRGTGALSFAREGSDFASKLTLGQIIKGRVLRSYEGSRYLVDFDGQQRVVDSAVPLTSNEIFYGRVVGLGDRVELHKVHANVTAAPAIAAAAPSLAPLGGKSGALIGEIFARFQAQLDPVQSATLQREVERAPQAEPMALSGLLLSKIGIPLTPDALRAVFSTLRAGRKEALFPLPDEALHLATQSAPPQREEESLTAFGVALASLLRQLPEVAPGRAKAAEGQRDGSANAAAGNGAGDAPPDLARIILNVQPGGSVAHRVGTLPLFVDGRLVELDIALFEQGDQAAHDEQSATRHRGIALAITLPILGRVELRARIAGAHMRLALVTDATESAQQLAQHAGKLAGALEAAGWKVDELAYQVRTEATSSAVARTVVEHLISPGSVSALA
jgi:hypothetical protein